MTRGRAFCLASRRHASRNLPGPMDAHPVAGNFTTSSSRSTLAQRRQRLRAPRKPSAYSLDGRLENRGEDRWQLSMRRAFPAIWRDRSSIPPLTANGMDCSGSLPSCAGKPRSPWSRSKDIVRSGRSPGTLIFSGSARTMRASSMRRDPSCWGH